MASKWIKDVGEYLVYRLQNMTDEEVTQAKQIVDTTGKVFKTVYDQIKDVKKDRKEKILAQRRQLEAEMSESWKNNAKVMSEYAQTLCREIEDKTITTEQVNYICEFLDISTEVLKKRYDIKGEL